MMSTELLGNLPLSVIAEIEEVAYAAWPGLEIEEADGWQLRFAAGITRRANSVWPNRETGHDALDLAARLSRVEAFYHARQLPARYQICPAARPGGLDAVLAARGYRITARTAVQHTTVERVLIAAGDATWHVEVEAQPSAAWWHCYAAADGVAPESVAVRQQICAAIKASTAYAAVMVDGVPVAVGSAATSGDWIGFYNIATLPAYRRRGAARALMAALVTWGRTQGATLAYLQVMADNAPALGLYAGLGFVPGYYYHYREEVRA